MKKVLQTLLAAILRGFVRIAGKVFFKLHVKGVENIPAKGGALLVANHVSFLDFMIVVCCLPRPVSFIMNADIYHKPMLKWLFKSLHCIPVSPRGGNNRYQEFNGAVANRVNSGHLVIIFAEGTVSRTGQILEFRKGVEHLAGLIQAPVIPINLHNVQGTPFSFQAGSKQMTKFNLKTLRQDVFVKFGHPMSGIVSAFRLRQKIKELEADNFATQVETSQSLSAQIREALLRSSSGGWQDKKESIQFRTLSKELSSIGAVLHNVVKGKDKIAVLLPKSHDAFLINLWCIIHEITVINIPPGFTNEERFFVVNHSGADLLITTIDMEFSRYSPNAREVIYMEHVREAMETGGRLQVFEKHISSLSRRMRDAFRTGTKENRPVTIIYERGDADQLRSVPLTSGNLLAALNSIKLVFPIEKSSMITNLPLYTAYGFVLEMLMPVITDTKVYIARSGQSPESFSNLMLQSKPELVVASPEQIKLLAALVRQKNVPELRHVYTAETDPQNPDIQLLRNRGIQIYLCAGSNMTTSVFAVNLLNYEGRDIAGRELFQENFDAASVGKALPGVAVKSCNEHFQELNAGETGTLWLKGACISEFAVQADNAPKPEMHGWVNSGLYGCITNQGFIHLHAKAS